MYVMLRIERTDIRVLFTFLSQLLRKPSHSGHSEKRSKENKVLETPHEGRTS